MQIEYWHTKSLSNTIKTIYGEVEYSRVFYQTKSEGGGNASIFLLDETLGFA